MTFEITLGNYINTLIIASGIGVSILSIKQIGKAPIRPQIRKYFRLFLILLITYLSMHLFRQIADGHPGDWVRAVIRTVTFIEFLVSGFMTCMLAVMILFIALAEEKAKLMNRILQGLLVLHIVMLIISQFTGLFYYFDELNHYHRSPLYIVSNLTPLLMMIQGMYLLAVHREKFSKPVAAAFWIYLISPLLAMILQAVWSEVQFVMIAMVGSAVNMFSVITDDLTAKYEKQQIEASRIDTELSMATRIQGDMLPNIFPAFPERDEIDIYASMNPAKEVGGDFYDFFLIDDNLLGIVMADVSGKGVPAALFMMASKILIQNYTIMKKNPKEALEAANDQICQSNREDMFVTVWLGVLDMRTGKLTACNAGHEYPVMKHPRGTFELLNDKHGFVIGAMPFVKYTEYELQLEKGSSLFLYTDGVPEATNGNKEMFGLDRMIESLNRNPDGKLEDILQNVRNDVNAFVGDAPQFDDLTMLCVRYNGSAEQ